MDKKKIVLDDCLIALKSSKNAPISKLFSFLIYDFSLWSYVLCVYTRKVTEPPRGGGAACGPTTETQDCNTQECITGEGCCRAVSVPLLDEGLLAENYPFPLLTRVDVYDVSNQTHKKKLIKLLPTKSFQI